MWLTRYVKSTVAHTYSDNSASKLSAVDNALCYQLSYARLLHWLAVTAGKDNLLAFQESYSFPRVTCAYRYL